MRAAIILPSDAEPNLILFGEEQEYIMEFLIMHFPLAFRRFFFV
jgi:hypothetical protein